MPSVRRDLIITAAFIILYLALYLYYVVPGLNSPEPSVLGMSVALAYSLLVWVLLMAVVAAAYLYVWR